MVQFNRLRLSGFKSFVDATDLVIEPGTTGIVGPNGCGKSNLVEALRWVMGETSAKRMRGSEMEDVIFAGSSERPARNIAEVSLLLDARDGAPPPGYAGESELEVSRRIEREMGSLYRINGKEVRARDVQLLFADSATGAHSTALVSQGRIGAIINARPTDRRSLLEEAAGITGLHSRRHEAELRLKAAETNLARLDDVIKTLEAQLSGLKKQARQALRYRTLADQIRRQEAVLLHIDSENGRLAQIEAKEALAASEALVASETERVASATVEEAAAAEALPQLRQEEATAGAALQRLLLGREALERELAQVEASLAEAERRLAQLASDRERAERQVADARSADEELSQELAQIIAADPAAVLACEEAKTALAEQETRVADEERALEALSSGLAADEARANEIARRLSDLAQRRQRLEEQAERAAAENAKLAEEAAADGRLLAAEEALRNAQSRQSEAKDAVDEAESTLARARADEQQARQLFQEAKSAHDRLAAEAGALAQLVEPSEQSLWAPMIDAVSVAPGFEAALGAALGDELSAPSDSAAPAHWRQLEEWSDTPALPDGVISLSLYVQGPPALARRLSQIGVLERAQDGPGLQHQLKPGQRLVTQAGDLWRWDGYTVRAEAVTAAGLRLQQKNRLQELRQLLAIEAPKVANTEAALKEREALLAAANEGARASRSALEAAFQALTAANRAQSQATQLSAEREARRAALAEQSRRLAEDLSECENAQQTAQQDQAALPDLAATRARVTEARARLAESRGLLTTCRSTLERLTREAELRRARQAAIGQERQSWQRRREDTERHLSELAERASATEGEIARLTERPPVIAQEQAKLAEMIEGATLQRRTAADRLAEGETRLMDGQRALREAEQSLSRAREARVRAEGAVEHAAQALSLLAERVAEKIGVDLDGLLAAAELDPSQELPPRAEVETRLQRLARERENLGVVNLRAEVEAQELDTQLAGMMNEKNDLIAAIARLRQGISSLNREGRERLLAAFDAVNKHFGELFTRLFGGGRAHLSLTEAEDPLEAGLEIMASPPGKRLQVLSLLSGGEQALTALALLFAVFLTNPAPICVLDEVDAPLDDANVDRFCALVDHLAAETGTRFLIITHHRLTMARMNRLYGVTMAERGVSQLVSVDLARAEEIRDRAA